jgi:hypothetical protein
MPDLGFRVAVAHLSRMGAAGARRVRAAGMKRPARHRPAATADSLSAEDMRAIAEIPRGLVGLICGAAA